MLLTSEDNIDKEYEINANNLPQSEAELDVSFKSINDIYIEIFKHIFFFK